MPRVALFRVDGSRQLGMGHIMRCIGFAQYLQDVKVESVFIIKDYDIKITKVVKNYGYKIQTIPSDCSFKDDASLTLGFASEFQSELIITDLSNTDTFSHISEYVKYTKAIKDTGRFLITIDGFSKDSVSNKRDFITDILIIPYCGAKKNHYKIANGTKLLLGSSYFIFRQEFVEAASKKRQIKKAAKNILITIGGGDTVYCTEKIIKSLFRLDRPPLYIKAILGVDKENVFSKKMDKMLKIFKGRYELIAKSYDMANFERIL
jgi:spore coat polysaccharide biosynthesis predicted glycosyltransferase SpsG